jgi:hypothetical protein
MPLVIAGTASDLTKTVSELVKELLENNWPTSAYNPLKSEIGFGLGTWDEYGDIDIHVQADRGVSRAATIGWRYTMVTDPVLIHLYVKSNTEEIPPNMGNAQRKIEEIVKVNAATGLGQGIQVLRWDGWERIFEDKNLQDVWHAIGRTSAIYWKVKV